MKETHDRREGAGLAGVMGGTALAFWAAIVLL